MKEFDSLFASLAKEDYCYLTTTGRITGKPHEIEIWFGLQGHTIYLLSGSGTSDWVKNLRKDPSVSVRIAAQTFAGIARLGIEGEEAASARYRVAEKYNEMDAGNTPDEWARTALVVAIDLNLLENKPLR